MAAPESEKTTALFSPTQQRMVGFALAFLALVISGYLIVRLVAGAVGLLAFFSGVIWPLATAGVLALVLLPLVVVVERRLKVRRVVAVIMIYGCFLVGLT